METKILIKTPKGSAKTTEKKLRPILLAFHLNKLHDVYTSPDDDEIVWVVNSGPRATAKIIRNVAMYDRIIHNLFTNKLMRKNLPKHLSQDDQEQLKDMLSNQTSVEVLKRATADEIVEDNTTLWQKIQRRFHRSDS